MPARTVVLEKLVKWNGETHADVTPGEYTQLTGRAGRRGIDVEGHAVVLWQPGLDPEAVAGLASTRTYPLRSSFRPTYNMAVNLVGQVGRSRAREILETSFAQFQADRAVVGLARQARRQEEALAGYAEAMKCHLGDFTEYAAAAAPDRRPGDRPVPLGEPGPPGRGARVAGAAAPRRRHPGAAGRRAGWAVVVDPGRATGADGPRPTVLTADRQVVPALAGRRPLGARAADPGAGAEDLQLAQPAVPARPRLDAAQRPRSRRGRPAAARRGRAARPPPTTPSSPGCGRALRAHPCHGCTEREDHARWAERWHRLNRETDALTRRIEGRTNTIARVFDRVCDLLSETGYLAGDTVTPDGQRLRRIYAESDLLVAECLREGVWAGLDAPGLAACVSAVVYESRRDDGARAADARAPPSGRRSPRRSGSGPRSTTASATTSSTPTPEPDLGLAWAVHRWASGHRLEAVLKDADLAAGDFVRWCKQVVDLLGPGRAGRSGGRRARGLHGREAARAPPREAVERRPARGRRVLVGRLSPAPGSAQALRATAR